MTRPPPFPNYPFFSPGAPLIRDFRTFDARKTSTRRGRIGTSCPVFGLRPTRRPLSRTVKLPNDEIARFVARQAHFLEHRLAQIGTRDSPAFHPVPFLPPVDPYSKVGKRSISVG